MGPLRELAAGLVLLTRPVVPQGAELERLRERALAVLRAFAAGGQPDRPGTQGQGPGSGRDRDPEFWKR